MRKLLLLAVFFMAGFIVGAKADEPVGKAEYQICSACHGVQGQGGIGPMLQGQTAEYIVDRLKSYKAGETLGKQSPMMWGNAALLSEEDIAKLAEYISKL
jgi:cytochrome c553